MTTQEIIRQVVQIGYDESYAKRLAKATQGKPKRYCTHCGSQVLVEVGGPDYPYYCVTCDENMYSIETFSQNAYQGRNGGQ